MTELQELFYLKQKQERANFKGTTNKYHNNKQEAKCAYLITRNKNL